MKYQNIREEEIKIKVGYDFFEKFDCSKILGNIDFCVILQPKHKTTSHPSEGLGEAISLLWAEMT